MEEIRIREARVGDLPHILHHRRAMCRDMGNRDEERLLRVVAVTERLLRDAMPRGEYRGWLAETAEGRVVAGAGILIVAWPGSPDDDTGRRGWIQNVYTEAEFRRRGLARRLMETAIEWCRAAEFVNVSLHASAFGRPLYEALGFRPTNEMRLRLRG